MNKYGQGYIYTLNCTACERPFQTEDAWAEHCPACRAKINIAAVAIRSATEGGQE